MKYLFLFYLLTCFIQNIQGQNSSVKIADDSVKYCLIKNLIACYNTSSMALRSKDSMEIKKLMTIGDEYYNYVTGELIQLQKSLEYKLDSSTIKGISTESIIYSKMFNEISFFTTEKGISSSKNALEHMDEWNKEIIKKLMCN